MTLPQFAVEAIETHRIICGEDEPVCWGDQLNPGEEKVHILSRALRDALAENEHLRALLNSAQGFIATITPHERAMHESINRVFRKENA